MKEYGMKCPAGSEPRILVTQEWIDRNKLRIDTSAAEEAMKDRGDVLAFGKEVAIDFLPFEDAKEFLKEEYVSKVEEGTAEYIQIEDVAEAAQDFLDYMVFAWMKAMDERGISASRSINKLETWMRILNCPDVAAVLADDNLYNPYGRPSMKKACKLLGIQFPDYL